MEDQNFLVLYNHNNEKIIDETFGIVHCHNHKCFIDNLKKYTSIAVVRNIFDSTISALISKETNVWTIRSDDELEKYKKDIKTKIFEINVNEFCKLAKHQDLQYTKVLSNINNIDLIINYENIKDNFSILTTALNLNSMSENFEKSSPKKTPIDKIKQVSNYSELLDAYKTLYIKNNF